MLRLGQQREHDLECLRLEAECMQLAATVNDRKSQLQFLKMARVWSTMAVQGEAQNAPGSADSTSATHCRTPTTV